MENKPILTPEEKRRIYEEEKTRLEAQEEIKQSQKAKPKIGCSGCLVILVGIIFLSIILAVARAKKAITPPVSVSKTVNTQEMMQSTQNVDSEIWSKLAFSAESTQLENIPRIIEKLECKRKSVTEVDWIYHLNSQSEDAFNENPSLLKKSADGMVSNICYALVAAYKDAESQHKNNKQHIQVIASFPSGNIVAVAEYDPVSDTMDVR